MVEYDISVSVDDGFIDTVDSESLRTLAERVLSLESVPKAELGILVTDDEQMRELNRDYAGEDKSTDVLSFSLREGEKFVSPDEIERLGEVIISYPTAKRQAEQAGRPVDDEVAHLLVHGVLHLLGYDHAEPEEERVMRAREERLLGQAH